MSIDDDILSKSILYMMVNYILYDTIVIIILIKYNIITRLI